MTSTASIVVGSVGLGLVAATSTPAFLTLYKTAFPRQREAGYQHVAGLYRDGDGVATEETQKQLSTLIPRCLALGGSVAGLLLAVAVAVLATIHPNHALFIESWLTLASWVRQVTRPENVGC